MLAGCVLFGLVDRDLWDGKCQLIVSAFYVKVCETADFNRHGCVTILFGFKTNPPCVAVKKQPHIEFRLSPQFNPYKCSVLCMQTNS